MAVDGGPAPARHPFLAGCGLPQAWAGRPQWRILDSSFGDALDFLLAWRAWINDPQRPRMLHYVALDESAVERAAVLLAVAHAPLLQPLTRLLLEQCDGLLPGVHRLVFERGHVLLTLCIGESDKLLRQLEFQADAVFLRAPGLNLKALARRCRRGTAMASIDPDGAHGAALQRHGFAVSASRNALVCGEFAPSWAPRGARAAETVPGECVVIGAGLAGAAAAASLARRGWKVQVLDARPAPAGGASGLPAGVLVPHTSPDDNLLSRLSRDGVRATLQQAHALLQAGEWEPSGVLEVRIDPAVRTPQQDDASATVWSRPADDHHKREAGLAPTVEADWHEKAAWIRPAALVKAWLATPGVTVRTGAKVAVLAQQGPTWKALDATGAVLAEGELVVVAAAMESGRLVRGLILQAVRGQVSWGLHDPALKLPPFPVNGDGSFIPSVPTPDGMTWLCGASFDRIDTDVAPRDADAAENQARLQRLLPAVAAQLEPAFARGTVRAWTGIRCASSDRRPLAGPVDEEAAPGLWLSTAMGSRGLTFAALSAELIAARIHGEPLPLARNLARSLYPERQKNLVRARAAVDE